MSWRDLGKLRQMHSRLSAETIILDGTACLTEPRPPITRARPLFRWVLLQSKLILSSIGWTRSFLAQFPRGAYLLHVAVNRRDEIVGFRTCNILGKRRNHKYIVEDMTVLRDDYQGKGLGTDFILAALDMVSSRVDLVFGEILVTNVKSMATFAKAGYKKIGVHTHKDGREFSVMVAHLPLRQPGTPRNSSPASVSRLAGPGAGTGRPGE